MFKQKEVEAVLVGAMALSPQCLSDTLCCWQPRAVLLWLVLIVTSKGHGGSYVCALLEGPLGGKSYKVHAILWFCFQGLPRICGCSAAPATHSAPPDFILIVHALLLVRWALLW